MRSQRWPYAGSLISWIPFSVRLWLSSHLLGCDEETARRFRLIAGGRGDRIHWFEDMADADRFNARSVARTRRLGLAALGRRMERAHAELIDRLERLPAAALADPSHAYTVVQWLPEPGWLHEQEHLAALKAWWRTRQNELARPARPRTRKHRARPG